MADTPADNTSTRLAWHALSEHILSAAAAAAATGRIGLRSTPGGIGTPTFPFDGGERRLRLVAGDLVIEHDGVAHRHPVTTLRDAGELVDIAPGAPSEIYSPSTLLDLDRDLGAAIEPGAAGRLAAFFALTEAALHTVSEQHAADDPAEIQLWPEHFDLATTILEVNLGGSPGDAEHDSPHLYVGPWVPRSGTFWNEPFGASRPFAELPTADAVSAFFAEGLAHAAAG